MNDKYLVLSTTSIGYYLYSLNEKTIAIKTKKKSLNYEGDSIYIGDIVYLKNDCIFKIEKRMNILKKPRLANIDFIFLVTSGTENEFNSYLLNKFLTYLNIYKLPYKIIITKIDILNSKRREEINNIALDYKKLNIDIYKINSKETNQYDFPSLLKIIKDKKVALIGQTGSGKSTLLNSIDPNFKRKVDSLFITSGRGRHTTKEVIALPFEGSFLFDTPGFSDLKTLDLKLKEIPIFFPGLLSYLNRCKFNDCYHLGNLSDCKLLDDVKEGIYPQQFYNDYLKLYEEIKETDVWKKKKPVGIF